MSPKPVSLFMALSLISCLSCSMDGRPVTDTDLTNTKIVYVSYEQDRSFVCLMDPDGSNIQRLIEGAMPCWSPDGNKIAFAARTEGNWDIYYMNAAGSNPVRLTSHTSEDVYPSWSPDGSMIAFNSGRSGSSQIWRTNVAPGDENNTWGYNLTQLTQDTPHKRVNNFHAWSPDGRWLAFEADRDRDDPEIYLANAVDGTNQQRLTFTRALDEVPAWTPDGQQIVFSSDMHGEPQSGDYDIYIMRKDGLDQRRLTITKGQASNPSVSPDGTKIVYDVREGDSSFIYVMDFDGSNPTRLVAGSNPAWSPFFAPKN